MFKDILLISVAVFLTVFAIILQMISFRRTHRNSKFVIDSLNQYCADNKDLH